MRRAGLAVTVALATLVGGAPAYAQDPAPAGELTEIRQGLAALYAELKALESHLDGGTSASGAQSLAGASVLERLASIERELQRLTARSEEMEFRIRRIVTDGTERVALLERRLCAQEPGCNPADLGSTPSLGGDAARPALPVPMARPSGPQLAVDERAAFDRAKALYDAGDYLSAIEGFAAHVATWPGGPLSIEAELLRGRALEGSGDLTSAARAYLTAFSARTDGPMAAESLTALGQALAAMGQTSEACVTLAEVGSRFADAPSAIVAAGARAQLDCP